MKKLILITLILLAVLKSEAKLAYGVKTSNDTDQGLLIHDFNEFDLTKSDVFELNRYGFGRGQLEITERPQVLAENRSGILIGNQQSGIKGGLELVNGQIRYQNRPFWQYEPGLSIGYKQNIPFGAIYIAPRAAMSYQNDHTDDLTGLTVNAQIFNLNASYFVNNYRKADNSLKIVDITLGNVYNVQQVEKPEEKIYYIGVKF